MRLTIIPIVLAVATLPVAARLLPRDGDRITVRQVAVISPEASGDGIVWDFSSPDVIHDNIEWRYDYAIPDTLLCVTRPGVRRDYLIAGDTLWHVCSETSNLRIGIDPPATASPAVKFSPFHERARYYQSQFFSGNGTSTSGVMASGSVILPHGGIMREVTLLHTQYRTLRTPLEFTPQPIPEADTDSTFILRTEDIYTWHSPALRYPLAETRIITDSIADIEYSRDADSWLALPEDQPYEPELRNLLDRLLTYSDSAPVNVTGNHHDDTPSPIPAADGITVTQTGDMAQASFTAQTTGQAGMVLADILGRVYASVPERTVTAGESVTFTVNTAGLPPGDYILHFTSGPDTPPVLVKIIRH